MKYILDAIFLSISACLCWAVWDMTAGTPLSMRVFNTAALGGVLILTDMWLHTTSVD